MVSDCVLQLSICPYTDSLLVAYCIYALSVLGLLHFSPILPLIFHISCDANYHVHCSAFHHNST